MKFLSNNFKHFVVICFSVLFLSSVYAATTDLAIRFMDKANEAFEDGNFEDAYKYVNQALAVSKDEEFQANVIYFAQIVYKQRLQNLLTNYDDMALIDIKMNLEKYPSLENTTIKKLIKQIEQDQLKREQNSVVDFTSNVDIDRIAKNLNGMKPNYAADILVAMDEKVTIQVLQKIEEISGFETVSQIISSLPSDKATEIRQLLNSCDEVLYFVTIDSDGNIQRKAEKRKTTQAHYTLENIITDLLAGPKELNNNMTLIPEGLKLLDFSINNETVILSFNDSFYNNTYGTEGYNAQLMQIVYTVTALQDFKNVQFLIQGKKVNYLTSDIYIGLPLDRTSFSNYSGDTDMGTPLNPSLYVGNSSEKKSTAEKKPELTSFNGISFGSSRVEAQKIMFNKGWKLESSSSKNPYTSDTYINGTYAGLTVSYITLYFFNDQLWQGYVQIKTENAEPVNRVLGTLQEKYGLVALKGKDTVKNGANFKCVDSVNGNWIDIQMTLINDKTIWYWYDINFYSQELSKIQETYNMVESVNNLKVHEDDL